MATAERLTAIGARRATRFLLHLGDEYRDRRLSLGLSQQQVADSVGMSRSVYSRIENGKMGHLSILVAAQTSSVLGLDLAVRAYPGGSPVRTPAHDARLRRVIAHVAPPLTQRSEVPLPQRPDAPTEQRAWDGMVSGDYLSADDREGVLVGSYVFSGQNLITKSQYSLSLCWFYLV